MPAVTVENPLVLPRIARPDVTTTVARPVDTVIPATHTVEGAGFEVWRPFPGGLSLSITDPFLLLDQLGPVEYGPNEAKGAPWHPHRGFETVTYVLDGEISHHDSNGGGGLIAEGDTQWMTAGGGILHDEVPSERSLRDGGPAHGVQLWVNLPSRLKFTPPRYQAITGDNLVLLSSARRRRTGTADRGRSRRSPGSRRHAHADHLCARDGVPGRGALRAVEPRVQRARVRAARPGLRRSDRPADQGPRARGLRSGRRASRSRAAEHQDGPSPALEVLLLGGLPIREPIVHYGPFVMNSRDEIIQAVDDFNAGRMGTIPAIDLGT